MELPRSSYRDISDEDLENEVYRRAIKRYENETSFKNRPNIITFIRMGGGNIIDETKSIFNGKSEWQNYKDRHIQNKIDGLNSSRFKSILREEYDDAYGNR